MQKNRVIVLSAVAALVGLAVGLLVGHFGTSRNSKRESETLINPATAAYVGDEILENRILRDVNPEIIRNHSIFLSKEPHIAGTPRDEKLAHYIHNQWKEYGLFDTVRMVPYDILLSYPHPTKENKVHIVDLQGNVIFTAANHEAVYNSSRFTRIAQAFNGYSPSGDVTGEPVYVNFGMVEDFEELEREGINVSNKICIARYGKIFRGNKLTNAQRRGAIALLLFLDPSEVALDGTDQKNVYPNTWWMPGSAMQRGSVLVTSGDPLTPGYPSLDGAYRYPLDEVDIPKIPSQPISYDDAKKILEMMRGDEVPEKWRGQLPVTYRFGPGFLDKFSNRRLRIIVNNVYKRATSYNVIATVLGAEEPDRYVLFGNHRDAWGFGSVDAVSGTSPMLEVSRVMGQLRREGWRPRRTLVFCSWGAEEYGLIGSTEFVEEHVHILSRAVANVNVDSCVSGDYLGLESSPQLADFLRDVTRLIPDPIEDKKTLYETKKAKDNRDQNVTTEPFVDTLGSGTDHASFSFYAGVPAINIWWKVDKKKYPISIYPSYHTAYETFHLVDTFIDPGFPRHEACARLTGLLTFRLATDPLVPFNMTALATKLQHTTETLSANGIAQKMAARNITLALIEEAISHFLEAAQKWHQSLSTSKMNPSTLRIANDAMMLVEKAFIKPEGLPNRPFIRHIAFAPSEFDSYSSAGFPAISDLLYGIDDLKEPELSIRWQQLERHISDILIAVRQASNILQRNPF